MLELAGDTARGYVFGRVAAAVRTADGYAVAGADDPGIALFDHRGQFLRHVGRRGKGPGEFTDLSWVGQCASDSLFVWDRQEYRISVFSGNGAFVRQFRVPINAANLECARGGAIGILLFPRRGNPPDPSGRTPIDTVSIRFIDQRGDSLGAIAGIPFGEGRVFGRITTFASRGPDVLVGTAEGPWLDRYDTKGRRLGRVRLPLEKRPTSRAAHERVIDMMLARMNGPRRDQQRAALLAMAIPDAYPPYRDLRISPNGVAWVTTGSPEDGDTTTTITGVSMEGRVLTSATLPLAARLLEAGNDYLIMRYESAEGEPRVGVFRVRPVR